MSRSSLAFGSRGGSGLATTTGGGAGAGAGGGGAGSLFLARGAAAAGFRAALVDFLVEGF